MQYFPLLWYFLIIRLLESTWYHHTVIITSCKFFFFRIQIILSLRVIRMSPALLSSQDFIIKLNSISTFQTKIILLTKTKAMVFNINRISMVITVSLCNFRKWRLLSDYFVLCDIKKNCFSKHSMLWEDWKLLFPQIIQSDSREIKIRLPSEECREPFLRSEIP